MTVVIVAEKYSAAKNFADAFGGMQGTFAGQKYKIVNLSGHLFEFVQPHDMLKDSSKSEQIRKWNLENLPWQPNDFTWKRKASRGSSSLLKQLRSTLTSKDTTEIVNGADLDPTGEGDLLFWEVIDEFNLHGKKFSRMEFVDESKKSLQKAFKDRRPIKSMMTEGGFLKADARAKMDLMTMQHTRIASLNAPKFAVLRQGRLKSAMVRLVGDQYEAWKNYVKHPYFQNRFKDENDVVYINPEEPKFEKESQVPNVFTSSPVKLLDKTNKSSPPPRLLDLAGLSARLSSQGIKAKEVLATYQKMYEAKIVSYPRTEDKTITFEQFNELLPLAPKIARAIGVDPKLLTHKIPRKSHVKDTGAHGANRPGPNVPKSLSDIKASYGVIGAKIYEILARNYLAMLAPDYKYERQRGCVEKYPKFIGAVNVPKSLGWRAIFDADDDFETAKGLGKLAKPFVYEGANPRPQHPTLRWLMAQLEKRNVGTGATRTSIYAETTNTRHKFPLLSETRGLITPTEFGLLSHKMLKDTRIGDLGATEAFYEMMSQIESFDATADDGLKMVTNWVIEDMETMKRNSKNMRKELGVAEQSNDKVGGVWNGQAVNFKRVWSGHEFTDAEVEALLDGQEITFTATSAKTGNDFNVKGKLEEKTFNTDDGKEITYVGFEPDFSGNSSGSSPDRFKDIWFGPDGPKEVSIKRSWGAHTFTDEELKKLFAGEEITFETTSRSGSKYTATGALGEGTFKNAQGEEVSYIGFQLGVPKEFLGVKFTDSQYEKLKAGKKIFVEGLTSKAGNVFNATLSYGMKEDGRKGLILDFG